MEHFNFEGAPALTSRGFVEKDFEKVIEFIDKACSLAQEAKSKTDKLKDFKEFINKDEAINKKFQDLRKEVEAFASKFPIPGFEEH